MTVTGLAGLCCLLSAGCVERLISITSEPSGALIHLNDEEVGRTPLTVPFTFYGTYDVRLEADGYKPLWTQRKAATPWWETLGIDLIAEALPDGKSHLKWHFEMELEPVLDEAGMLDRARQMRVLVADPTPETPPQGRVGEVDNALP